jgi:hypothetical protein
MPSAGKPSAVKNEELKKLLAISCSPLARKITNYELRITNYEMKSCHAVGRLRHSRLRRRRAGKPSAVKNEELKKLLAISCSPLARFQLFRLGGRIENEELRIEEAVRHSLFAVGWKNEKLRSENEELKKLFAIGYSPLAGRMKNYELRMKN